MGTFTGVFIGVAFASPITALITNVMQSASAKLSDPELLDGVVTAVSNKTAELAPKVIDEGAEKVPRLIDMILG